MRGFQEVHKILNEKDIKKGDTRIGIVWNEYDKNMNRKAFGKSFDTMKDLYVFKEELRKKTNCLEIVSWSVE